MKLNFGRWGISEPTGCKPVRMVKLVFVSGRLPQASEHLTVILTSQEGPVKASVVKS